MKSNKEIGEFFAELRKEKQLTQLDLAIKLNVSDKAISKWETGKSFPSTKQLNELSKIFGITIDELLYGERCNNKEKLFETLLQKEREKNSLLKKTISSLIYICLACFFISYWYLVNTSICGKYIILNLFAAILVISLSGLQFNNTQAEIVQKTKKPLLIATIIGAVLAVSGIVLTIVTGLITKTADAFEAVEVIAIYVLCLPTTITNSILTIKANTNCSFIKKALNIAFACLFAPAKAVCILCNIK